MIRIFFLSQSSPILELFPFDKITLKSYICTVVTVMAKQCWSQTVLESGSWGHSVLQTPALVLFFYFFIWHSALTLSAWQTKTDSHANNDDDSDEMACLIRLKLVGHCFSF